MLDIVTLIRYTSGTVENCEVEGRRPSTRPRRGPSLSSNGEEIDPGASIGVVVVRAHADLRGRGQRPAIATERGARGCERGIDRLRRRDGDRRLCGDGLDDARGDALPLRSRASPSTLSKAGRRLARQPPTGRSPSPRRRLAALRSPACGSRERGQASARSVAGIAHADLLRPATRLSDPGRRGSKRSEKRRARRGEESSFRPSSARSTPGRWPSRRWRGVGRGRTG